MEYKWKCKLCKKEFEQNIPMSEYDLFKESEHECPFCKKMTLLERVFEKFGGSIQLTNGMYGVGYGGWNR